MDMKTRKAPRHRRVVHNCMECANLRECMEEHGIDCPDFAKGSGEELLDCGICARRGICEDYKRCKSCKKVDKLLPLAESSSTPDLRRYAAWVDQTLPIEPSYVAVDDKAIRFFASKPRYVRSNPENFGKWMWAERPEEEVATIKWNGAMLDGVVDLSEFESQGRILWEKCCIQI